MFLFSLFYVVDENEDDEDCVFIVFNLGVMRNE